MAVFVAYAHFPTLNVLWRSLLLLLNTSRGVSMVLCFASVACLQSSRIRIFWIIWIFKLNLIPSAVANDPTAKVSLSIAGVRVEDQNCIQVLLKSCFFSKYTRLRCKNWTFGYVGEWLTITAAQSSSLVEFKRSSSTTHRNTNFARRHRRPNTPWLSCIRFATLEAKLQPSSQQLWSEFHYFIFCATKFKIEQKPNSVRTLTLLAIE